LLVELFESDYLLLVRGTDTKKKLA